MSGVRSRRSTTESGELLILLGEMGRKVFRCSCSIAKASIHVMSLSFAAKKLETRKQKNKKKIIRIKDT